MKKKPIKIAVFLNWSLKLAHHIHEGLIQYAQQKSDWRFTLLDLSNLDHWKVRDWDIDGLITAVNPSTKRHQNIEGSKFPIVNCAISLNPSPLFPEVDTDLQATGQMAADYFLDNGFENFACVAYEPGHPVSRRTQHFCEHLTEHGIPSSQISTFHTAASGTDDIQASILRGLPKPAAIYCATDMAAAKTIRNCMDAGLKIPDEVAVLGTEDDDFLCRGSRPYISSIHLPYERVGVEAARCLDLQLQGEAVPASTYLPPESITVRQSTDTLAIRDDGIRNAVIYIREHAAENPTIAELASQSGLSSCIFHRRFKEILGTTPQQQIIQEKLKQVKALLRNTHLNMTEIADQTGFSGDQHLHHTFHQKTGQTPGRYRKMFGN